MNRNDSFSGWLDNAMAGIMAPSKLPKCGVPVLCTPVSIFDMVLLFLNRKDNCFLKKFAMNCYL
jgi:hypothetical protein